MKKIFLLAILLVNTQLCIAGQSSELEKLGVMPAPAHCFGETGENRTMCKGMTSTEWQAYKQEVTTEQENVKRAKSIEQDMQSCIESSKKWKGVYWDQFTGKCVWPDIHAAGTMVDLYITSPTYNSWGTMYLYK